MLKEPERNKTISKHDIPIYKNKHRRVAHAERMILRVQGHGKCRTVVSAKINDHQDVTKRNNIYDDSWLLIPGG